MSLILDPVIDRLYYSELPEGTRPATIKDFADEAACRKEQKEFLLFAKMYNRYYLHKIPEWWRLSLAFRTYIYLDRVFVFEKKEKQLIAEFGGGMAI